MAWYSALLGGGVKDMGEGVNSVLGGIGSLAKDIRSAITGEVSPEAKAEINAKLMEIEAQASLAQTNINLVEAKHKSIFVAGWRPFVGWVCGSAFLVHFILFPMIETIAIYKGIDFTSPSFDMETLTTVLFALLGFGAYRTVEKKMGVQDRH